MLQDDNDKEGEAFPLEFDALDSVGVAVFLEKGQVALVHILDVPGFDIFEHIQGDKTAQELDEKFVVVKDGLETVIFGFFDSHRNTSYSVLWSCLRICFSREEKNKIL
jgi:hypothetical protein